MTLTVIDSNNNTVAVTATVNVIDTIKPLVLGCPSNDTVAASINCGYILPDFTSAMTFSDSCGIQSVVQIPSSSSTVGLGQNPISIITTDVNGNIDSCTFFIQVNDSLAPVISCASDTSLSTDPGSCGAVFTYTPPLSTDNCGIDTLIQLSGLPSGSLFPIDSTLISYVAIDSSGNTDTCSYYVIISDNEPPSLTCPSDTIICEEFFSYQTPISDDNCGIQSIDQIAGLPSGSSFPIGSTVNTFVVTDSSGNTDTCSFVVSRESAPSAALAGSDQQICDTTESQLSASTVSIGVGSWSAIEDVIISDTSSNITTVSNLSFGDNTFIWTVSNSVCPVNRDTVFITVDQRPSESNAGPDGFVCDTNIFTLQAVDPAIGVGTWSTISSAIIDDETLPITRISSLAQGTSVFTWTNTNGVCPPSRDDVSVIVGTTPILEAGECLFTQGESTIPIGTSIDQPASISWEPTFLIEDPTSDSTNAFIEETTQLTVTASNDALCTSTDTILVYVLSELEINNTFTPNGDSYNDTWDIEGSEYYPKMVVRVFNRWGAEVFKSDDGYRTPFDGTFNGKLLPVSSYYYIIEFNDGISQPRDGNLTIIY
ncbi:MAG: hypothetical protein Salg2KO_05270 [Salibacteraceae bacterium]